MISINVWSALEKFAAIAVIASVLSAAFIAGSRTLLVRYAIAPPNARSSHSKPTPQGGGIGVIGATFVAVGCAYLLVPEAMGNPGRVVSLFASVIALAALGLTDDIRPLNAMPRIVLQIAAAALVISTLPADLRLVPNLPGWLERAFVLIGCVWFINLVNFMDGIDWMTVAEVVPITAGLGIFGLMGALPQDATFVAIALFGGIVGFAPFNRPVARLFLGDVGSLPIGLILSWMLILLAGNGHLAAALLLPLYYLADATITLAGRMVRGESIAQAHRGHFYQRATDAYSIYQIVGIVFALNVVLVALAAVSIWSAATVHQIAVLAIGGALVGTVLWIFNSVKD
jgi:UDP-N-acetylmuramyl pentapeptide phosphotransferase/UDP-N-acetylglucosamine-1-phosphate transferase